MRIFLFLFLIALGGCQPQATVSTPPERTGRLEPALIFASNLAADGCIEHIQLLSDSLRYVPTAASLPVLQQALNDKSIGVNPVARAINPVSKSVLICLSKPGGRLR